MSALIQLLQTAENLLNRGEIAEAQRFIGMAKNEAAEPATMSWEKTMPGRLDAIIGRIEEINDCEIGMALDAMKQIGDLESGGPTPVYQCIRDKLQAAKNDIEALCDEAGKVVSP
jgi:hypothetical protein